MSEPADHLDRTPQGALAVADRPPTPRQPRQAAGAMISGLLAGVAAQAGPPGDARGDCLRLAIDVLHARAPGDYLGRLESAAESWARDGVSIAVVNGLHAGFREVLNRIGSRATSPQHRQVVVAAAELVAELIGTVSSTVMAAHFRQLGECDSDHHPAIAALLRGEPVSEIRARYGIATAENYRVLALATQPSRGAEHDAAEQGSPAQRLRRAFAERTGDATLSSLSARGGTILVHDTEVAATAIEHVVAEIGRAATVSVTATVVMAPATDIAGAAERAHELLDIVQRLELPSGLYGFDELALEYQLTRPGPALAHLRALLAPLDDHPELLTTLRCHIAVNLNRQRTGKTLNLHPNTVDYRLRRIARLTGLHPHCYPDLWYLRSALIVHSVRLAGLASVSAAR